MRPSPALRALAGFGGTLAALGGATLVVSTAMSAVIRVAARAQQAKKMVPCRSCCDDCENHPSTSTSTPPGKRRCAVCQGRRAVRWQPFSAPLAARWTLCPLCAGKGLQACLNCSGTGKVVGSDEEVKERREKEAAMAAEAAATEAEAAIQVR